MRFMTVTRSDTEPFLERKTRFIFYIEQRKDYACTVAIRWNTCSLCSKQITIEKRTRR